MPDADNVIPIVDGDWFEDDIVARFRQFLRAAFGEQHFEENLRFVTESLGVKDLRDYFVKSFYKDHVQRYKKRPIYWLFSSPKGSFNALIYMHRYTPSTVSTVLNEYLREFKAKLKASLEHPERSPQWWVARSNNAEGSRPAPQGVAGARRVRARRALSVGAQHIAIDLDDGVKANYPKFGAALKKIPGLEAANDRSRHRQAAPGAPLRRHRVVFWHDPEGQYASDLDSLDLPGVTTVRVANDEYAIKNRLLHDQPTTISRLPLRSGAGRHRQLAP